MNYRRIQGGQERSQTNEHGGNCDLSIASNLQMNNSKISVLRWSKVSKKLHFYKFIEKETYLLCQTKRSTLKQGSQSGHDSQVHFQVTVWTWAFYL